MRAKRRPKSSAGPRPKARATRPRSSRCIRQPAVPVRLRAVRRRASGGRPASSIGKFGSDTDNWIWPRTGRLAVPHLCFGDNKPAAYSPTTCLTNPKTFQNLHAGVGENDTMIYGFPGNTRYILSDAVAYIAERSDPAKIAVRTGRLDIISGAQEAIRRCASTAPPSTPRSPTHGRNGRAKYWASTGGNGGEARLREEFGRGRRTSRIRSVVGPAAEYARIADAYFARNHPRDPRRCPAYTPRSRPKRLRTAQAPSGSTPLRVRRRWSVYRRSPREAWPQSPKPSPTDFQDVWEGSDTTVNTLAEAPSGCRTISWLLGTRRCATSTAHLNELYTAYKRAARWDAGRAFFPDANLTLRVAYGHVAGYEYADGEYHKPRTTIDGIIAKDNPEIYDYDIPQALRDIHASKEYGRWATRIDGRTTVPVCFLATNHTTGGNSGSPILNARGELVGVNFDRTWRSTMSDVAFDETICRNIAVASDTLFVIDRIGGAGYLFGEMDFSRRK
ncbi:MAG: S46 family peptidase [Alistipes onderdonkii]